MTIPPPRLSFLHSFCFIAMWFITGVASLAERPRDSRGDGGSVICNFLPAITGVAVTSKLGLLGFASFLVFTAADCVSNFSTLMTLSFSFLNQVCSRASAAVIRSFGSAFSIHLIRSRPDSEIDSHTQAGKSKTHYRFLSRISSKSLPLNRRRPVNITYIMTPALKTSA